MASSRGALNTQLSELLGGITVGEIREGTAVSMSFSDCRKMSATGRRNWRACSSTVETPASFLLGLVAKVREDADRT